MVHNGKVEFKLCELPNDMTMLACLAGELTNSAYFCTTFASVNKGGHNNRNYTFGNKKHNGWKRFPYQQRISGATNVEKFKLRE